ncbi:hypothetical protein F5B21DRAFT_503094 [Xylaria acuta]|nr:hypothetical protein F5B21DRAFT_503094 [Xylaria acuta]
MSVPSPHIQHQIAIRISDAPPKALANKHQPYDSLSPNLGSFNKTMNKPIALPNPPRPPTPGPPRPYPPIPPQPPVPTPPPSPHNLDSLIVLSSSLSNPQQLPPIPVAVSEPGFHQCPYPNPPPSPGPRRPGPVNPRPNVPTPPPSPRRSITTSTTDNGPWVFLSTASSFAILLLEYLSSATWNEQGATAHEGHVSTAARDDMTCAPNGTARDNLVHGVLQIVTPRAELLGC